MLQLITNDEMTTVNLTSATVVHNDDKTVKVLINADSLSEQQREMLENQEGFSFSFNYGQDCIKTKEHYITTSVVNGGGDMGLLANQWLIEFKT